MGNERFFNWRSDSTCQTLVAEIAKQLNSRNTISILNSFNKVTKEDGYIVSKMMYYYYKAIGMFQLNRTILKYIR